MKSVAAYSFLAIQAAYAFSSQSTTWPHHWSIHTTSIGSTQSTLTASGATAPSGHTVSHPSGVGATGTNPTSPVPHATTATDKTLYGFDNGERRDVVSKAQDEAKYLVGTVTGSKARYRAIWDKYFPRHDHVKVQAVWDNILKTKTPGFVRNPSYNVSENLDTALLVGGDAVVIPDNYPIDMCDQGMTAWTFPGPKNMFNRSDEAYTVTHLCPEAFKLPHRYSDIESPGEGVRVSDDMRFLGGAILGGWVQNDLIGKAATGMHIGDQSNNTGFANTQYLGKTDEALSNADSYVSLALEVFWTAKATSLADAKGTTSRDLFHYKLAHGTPMNCTLSHRKHRQMCPTVSEAGYCDCGSQGYYPPIGDADPCASYRYKPTSDGIDKSAVDLISTKCSPVQRSPICDTLSNQFSYKDAAAMLDKFNTGFEAEALCCANDGSLKEHHELEKGTEGAITWELDPRANGLQCIGCSRLAAIAKSVIRVCQKPAAEFTGGSDTVAGLSAVLGVRKF